MIFDRLRNQPGAGAGDLDVAVEHRHGDLGFGIVLQPLQHVGETADIEGVRRSLAGTPAEQVQQRVVVVVAVHRQHGGAATARHC